MKKLVLKDVTKQTLRPGWAHRVIIACDLSRSKWALACRWGGQEHRRLCTPPGLRHLQAVVKEYQGYGSEVHVVYEACGFGYEIAWWLKEQQATVLVVAPSTVERARGAQVKSDRLDASTLGLKYERGMLKGIYIPNREQHQNRQLSRSYAQVIADRRRQQARIRMLLQEHGLEAPVPSAGWTALLLYLDQHSLPAVVAACVSELRLLRETANVSAKRLGKALRAMAVQPPYRTLVKALSKQPGVGSFTAIRFILEIGSIERFASAESLVNYLGLTPSEYSSGEKVHRGHVRKCGPASLRGWIVQCAWVAVHSGKDRALLECFERLAPRVGKKKAIVAVARRLALRLRARWLETEQALTQAA